MKKLGLKKVFAFILVALSVNALAVEKTGKGQAIAFNEEGVPLILTVKANVEGDKITILDVTAEHEETPTIGGKALTKLIADLKTKQDTENIDVVAGATATSKAFKSALKKAIKDIKSQK